MKFVSYGFYILIIFIFFLILPVNANADSVHIFGKYYAHVERFEPNFKENQEQFLAPFMREYTEKIMYIEQDDAAWLSYDSPFRIQLGKSSDGSNYHELISFDFITCTIIIDSTLQRCEWLAD